MIQAGAEVRPATEGDLGAINEIYNHYVADSHVTFDLDPMNMEGRREWFSHYQESGPYRLFVAVEGDRVIGFASSSPFKSRPGYVTSVETSIYLASDAVGKGAGAQLLREAVPGHRRRRPAPRVRGHRAPESRLGRPPRALRFQTCRAVHGARPQVRQVLGRGLVREATRPRLRCFSRYSRPDIRYGIFRLEYAGD